MIINPRKKCLPPSGDINWAGNLDSKACLLFLELEYPSSFMIATTKCCSRNHISSQIFKIWPNVQFTWPLQTEFLFPFINHLTTTQLEYRYHVLYITNSSIINKFEEVCQPHPFYIGLLPEELTNSHKKKDYQREKEKNCTRMSLLKLWNTILGSIWLPFFKLFLITDIENKVPSWFVFSYSLKFMFSVFFEFFYSHLRNLISLKYV